MNMNGFNLTIPNAFKKSSKKNEPKDIPISNKKSLTNKVPEKNKVKIDPIPKKKSKKVPDPEPESESETEEESDQSTDCESAESSDDNSSIESDESSDSNESTDDESSEEEINDEEYDPKKNLGKIEKTEMFNMNYLYHIIENKQYFKTFMKESSFKDNKDPFEMAEKYLSKSINGKIDVTYSQRKSHGRFYANKSLSLQSLCKKIRHTIAKEHYVDLDIANCHPVLLQYLCKKNNFVCTQLTEYIKNRDKYTTTGPDRDQFKEAFLCATNGGGKTNLDELINDPKFGLNCKPTIVFLKKYRKEMITIHEGFYNMRDIKRYDENVKKRREKGKDYNHKASYMNNLLCDLENDILMEILNFFKNPKDAILIFDGLMLKIKRDKYDLSGCEKHISSKFKGLKISLIEKPMNEYFDMSNRVILDYSESEKQKEVKSTLVKRLLNDILNNNDINDHELANLFHKSLQDELITIDDFGNGYYWNNKVRLWEEKTAKELQFEICNPKSMILSTLLIIKDQSLMLQEIYKNNNEDQFKREKIKLKQIESIINRVKSTRNVKDIFTQASTFFLNVNFKDKIVNRSHNYLPLKNGKVIDLRDASIRDRQKTDYFSFECPVEYIDPKNWTKQDTNDNSKFINQIFVEDQEYIDYFQIKGGSYLSGICIREVDIWHGDGLNGKSKLINALSLILNNFCANIDKSAIVFDPTQHRRKGGGNHTSHMMPIDGKRLILIQELEDNDTIDSEIIKKLASSDPIEGVRECYGRRTLTLQPFCKTVIASNKIPKYDIKDKAIIDRLVFNPFKARFLNPEKMKDEKDEDMYNEEKYKYYPADDNLVRKFQQPGRTLDILFSWLVQGCIKYYQLKDAGLQRPAIVKGYIKDKIKDNDLIQQWIADRCETKTIDEWKVMNNRNKPDFIINAAILHTSYLSWAEENDMEEKYGRNDFYKYLVEKYPKIKVNNTWAFQRIRIKVRN